MDELREVALDSLEACQAQGMLDWASIKSAHQERDVPLPLPQDQAQPHDPAGHHGGLIPPGRAETFQRERKTTMWKRPIAGALALVLSLSLLASPALATETKDADQQAPAASDTTPAPDTGSDADALPAQAATKTTAPPGGDTNNGTGGNSNGLCRDPLHPGGPRRADDAHHADHPHDPGAALNAQHAPAPWSHPAAGPRALHGGL